MEKHSAEILHLPTQGERFKWFAVSHFAISIVGVIGAFFSTLLGGVMLTVLFLWEAVLLALYAFAGMWVARKRKWKKPQRTQDGVYAFLFPALVAWVWGGLFLVFLCVPGLMFDIGGTVKVIAIILMYSLLLLAFPSSAAFIMLTLFVGGMDANFSAEWSLLFAYTLILGAVPPALFVLGSVFGVRKEQREVPQE